MDAAWMSSILLSIIWVIGVVLDLYMLKSREEATAGTGGHWLHGDGSVPR